LTVGFLPNLERVGVNTDSIGINNLLGFPIARASLCSLFGLLSLTLVLALTDALGTEKHVTTTTLAALWAALPAGNTLAATPTMLVCHA
jgi:hypothetical protein